VTGIALAWEIVEAFVGAVFSGKDRFKRRLEKVAELERDRA